MAGFAHAAVARSAVATDTPPIASDRPSNVNGIADTTCENTDNATTDKILLVSFIMFSLKKSCPDMYRKQ